MCTWEDIHACLFTRAVLEDVMSQNELTTLCWLCKLTSNPNRVTIVAIDVGDVTPERAPRIRARFRDKYVDVRITLGSLSSWKPGIIAK